MCCCCPSCSSFISLALTVPAVIVGALNQFVLHAPLSHVGLWLGLYPAVLLVVGVPLFGVWMFVRSHQMVPQTRATDVDKYFSFPNAKVKSWFGKGLDKTVRFFILEALLGCVCFGVVHKLCYA